MDVTTVYVAHEMTDPSGERTLRQVAEELGVHYMTAYRYVRLGMLPAHKVGSTWRVTDAALAQFRSPPEDLGPDDGVPSGQAGRWHRRFEARLLVGDTSGAWSVLEATLSSGVEVDEVYLDVIGPAMVSIGERWARGEIDIAEEHLASVIVSRLLGRLGPRFARAGRTRGAVVLGAAPGDAHGLPVSLLADLVVGDGFEVIDLGADVPAESFVHAARQAARLVAVGIAMTCPDLDAAVAATVDTLHDAIPGIPVILGGSAVTSEGHADRLGADAYASSARRFVALLADLVMPKDRLDPPMQAKS